MSFFSFSFIIFLLIVVGLYWIKANKTWQNIVLVIASLIFMGFIHPYFAYFLLAYTLGLFAFQKVIARITALKTKNYLYDLRQFAQFEFRSLVANYCYDQPDHMDSLEQDLYSQTPSDIQDYQALIQASVTHGLDPVLIAQQQIITNKLAVLATPEFNKQVVNYQLEVQTLLIHFYRLLSLNLAQTSTEQLATATIIHYNNLFIFAEKCAKAIDFNWEQLETYRQTVKALESSSKENKDQTIRESSLYHQLEHATWWQKVSNLELRYAKTTLNSREDLIALGQKSIFSSWAFSLIIFASLLPLIYFKYSDFILENFYNFASALGFANVGNLLYIVPILGISYYTFNAISFLVGVKRGEIRSQDLLTTLTYITYFPTIVAGPIMRATYFIPYLTKARKLDNVGEIFFYLTIGITKKWLLATLLSSYFVSPVFGSPNSYNSLEIILALYGYAFQLYFDFSGYVDLMYAIGLCFGIRHYPNFNRPYTSANIKDFWRRWHISLSNWIRDYIYIPLGGNHDGFILAQCYTVIAMMLSGLWHGVTINFLLWGFLHTFGIIAINIMNRLWKFRIQNYSITLARFITFNYICLTWAFFNSGDFQIAINLLQSIFTNITNDLSLDNSVLMLVVILSYYFSLPYIHKFTDYLNIQARTRNTYQVVIVAVLILTIVVNLAPTGVPPFIYADF